MLDELTVDACSSVEGAVVKPRILILVEAFYPGWKSGGPTQSVKNIILILNEKFDVYVVNRCRDVNSRDRYSGIVVNEWMYIDKFKSNVIYLTDKWVSVKRFGVIFREVNPTHIYLNSLWNVSFSMKPLAACCLLGMLDRVVLNPRGELNPNAIAFKRGRKVAYATVLAGLGVARKIRWNATNEIEAKLIRQRFGEEVSITILPNIPRQDQIKFEPRRKPNGALRLIFLSRISRMKNLLFLIHALKLTKSITNFELLVYGPVGDEDYFEEFQNSLLTLPSHVLVSYEGAVIPDRVLTVLQNGHFFVLPTLGENFGHAIFDAWSAALPVLISQLTPWRNLQEKKLGWDLPLSESIWASTLDKAGEMRQEEYNDLCKSSLAYAVYYRYETSLADKVEKLFS